MDANLIKTALFIDFDNIFMGLHSLEQRAARKLATEPSTLLNSLMQEKVLVGDRTYKRDILVRRAYCSPNSFIRIDESRNIYDPDNRLYLNKFRANFVQAGFEIIDCPALTAGMKNAADIRIVIDVLSHLRSATQYDEFIIASGDADFTPLLHYLRANDCKTMIIAAGPLAFAYENVAHFVLKPEDLISLLLGDDDSLRKAESALLQHPEPQPPNWPPEYSSHRQELAKVAKNYIENSPEPVSMPYLGNYIRGQLGKETVTKTLGSNTLRALLQSMDDTKHFKIRENIVWDPNRHEEPPRLPESILRICQITKMPTITSNKWHEIFEVLAAYTSEQGEGSLSQCAAWCRDYLQQKGIQVPRKHINSVIIWAHYGGVAIDTNPPPQADEIREAVIQNTINLAQAKGAVLSAEERNDLKTWLQGKGILQEPPRANAVPETESHHMNE